MANDNSGMCQTTIMNRLMAKTEDEIARKVLACCHTDPVDGVVYRGKVDKVLCSKCKLSRWDDGTRCATPWCRAWTTQRFTADDEREG